MANEKRITVEELEKAIGTIDTDVADVEWKGLHVSVQNRIPFGMMLAMVDRVVEIVFGDDGTYMPELKDFAIRNSVVELYTNLTLPDGAEKRYNILFNTDIWEVLVKYIDEEQFSMATEAIDAKIEATVNTNTINLNRQIAVFQDAVEKMNEQLTAVFDNINTDDLRKLMGAINNGGLDEEKLVKAFIKNKEGKEQETSN